MYNFIHTLVYFIVCCDILFHKVSHTVLTIHCFEMYAWMRILFDSVSISHFSCEQKRTIMVKEEQVH